MCWQDREIALKTKSKAWTTTTSTNIPANGKRIGLFLCANNGNSADVRIFIDSAVQNTILHSSNNHAQTSEFSDTNSDYASQAMIGDLIYSQLQLVAIGGGRVTLIETWIDDPPAVAQAGVTP